MHKGPIDPDKFNNAVPGASQASNNGSLPFSEDAEKGVLCSLILNPAFVAPLLAQISPNAFYAPAHPILFDLLLEWEHPERPVDFIWAKKRLEDSGQLKGFEGKEGALQTLNSLWTFVPTHLNAAGYIQTVAEKYALRRCTLLFDKMSIACKDRVANPSLILAEAESTLLEIARANNGAGDGLPQIQSLAEIITENQPKPPEIITGILHQGLKLMVGGPSKARKTWLLMHLALAIATGRLWLGQQCLKGAVLYINFELPEPFFKERALWILKQMGIDGIPPNFYELNLRGYAGPAEEILPKVARKIRQLPPLLAIVIDPTYKLMGTKRDENSAVDIASLMNEVDRLAVQTGASVISAAHFAKGNASAKEAIDRIAGSGVFGRDPDSILMMSPLTTDDAFQLHFILRCLPPKQEIAIKWTGWCFEPDATLDPTDLKKIGGRPAKYSANDLLEVLGDESLSDKGWQQKSESQKGISKAQFHRIKKELADTKRIYFSKIDNTWSLLAKKGRTTEQTNPLC